LNPAGGGSFDDGNNLDIFGSPLDKGKLRYVKSDLPAFD
jgi:hypothetical protein